MTVSPVLWALATFGILLPACLLPLSVRQPCRIGQVRRPGGARALTVLVISFLAGAVALVVTARLLGRATPKAVPAVVAALGIGVVLGLLALSLSSWHSRRGVVYFQPTRRVSLAIAAMALLRIAYGVWRLWVVGSSAAGQPRWLVAAGMAGTLVAAAVLAGYGLGLWGGVRLRIARWKATSMFAYDESSRHPSSMGPDSTMMLQR